MGSASSKPSSLEHDLSKLDGKTWDYVIVGGGTAGCVLASRLSEDPKVSVLLLEAGQNNDNVLLSKVPLAFAKLFKSENDWDRESVAQKTLDSRTIYWPGGKLLGGTSSMNAAVYHHCAPSDYDEWARLCKPSGDETVDPLTDWSYESILPYFKKAEKFQIPASLRSISKAKAQGHERNLALPDTHQDVDLSHRGLDGVYETSFGACNPICQDAVRACEKVGIPYTADFNTPKGTLGAAMFAGTVDAKGHRSSAATAYLSPSVILRKNLTVATNSFVTQVLFDESGSNVVGVRIARTPSNKAAPSPETWTVKAKKEVILSAGVVATPQLLLLSGVGPVEELQKHDITVIKDLPCVGTHLKDQPMVVLSLRAVPNTTLAWLDSAFWGLYTLAKWLLFGKGIYTAIAAQGGAFVRSDDIRRPFNSKTSLPLKTEDNTSGPAAPDIELAWMAAPFINNTFTQPPKGTEVFTLAAILVRPQSKGSLTLKSKNPYDKPLIDPKYLSTESDVNVMVKALRLMLHVSRQEPLCRRLMPQHAIDKSVENIFWPGDANPDDVSDEELREFLVRTCATIYHGVGTARMGLDPSTSVVDTSLKVHGVSNLRIVDASVFPDQLSGHPAAGVIAVAEKASDIIKKANI